MTNVEGNKRKKSHDIFAPPPPERMHDYGLYIAHNMLHNHQEDTYICYIPLLDSVLVDPPLEINDQFALFSQKPQQSLLCGLHAVPASTHNVVS